MKDLTADDLDAITHTVLAIGRTGATAFEVGFLDDEEPHRWWASAQYRGAKVACEACLEAHAAWQRSWDRQRQRTGAA